MSSLYRTLRTKAGCTLAVLLTWAYMWGSCFSICGDGATSFVQHLECTTSDVQHLGCTTNEYTTPWIYNTWIYNNLDVQHLEYTTPWMYNTLNVQPLNVQHKLYSVFILLIEGGGRHYSLHDSCLPIKFTNPSISQSRLYSSLSFIRLILTNTQVSSTLVFPDSFLQSHKFTKGNKIRMKF